MFNNSFLKMNFIDRNQFWFSVFTLDINGLVYL